MLDNHSCMRSQAALSSLLIEGIRIKEESSPIVSILIISLRISEYSGTAR